MRILFLQKRILFPADVGGKIRTLNVLRHLAQWHDITYLCNLQPGEEVYVDDMQALGLTLETIPWRETSRSSPRFYGQLAANLFSSTPFNVNKDFDPRLRAKAEQLLARQEFDLVICDFVQMARNAMGLNAPASLLFQHNVEAEIFQRHATSGSGFLRRWYMRGQWKKMKRFEGVAGAHFDRVVAVSDRDREIFERDYGWTHVDVIDTAVDLAFFKPMPGKEVADRIMFLGSLDWLPNEGGVQFFVDRIWPRIKEQRPQATFHIVGRRPSPLVQRLAEHTDVSICADVDDVRPHLAEATVFVVPLLVGGGTRLKIFEAMAMQKAVISTSLGAEGLELTNEEDVLLRDDPREFADQVIRLLEDNEERQRIGTNGRNLVVENYSAETVAKQFEEACVQAVAAGGANTNVRSAEERACMQPS